MNWQQIRELYPHRWVVVEALDAHTEIGKRIVNQMSLVDAFGDDWGDAWECYKQVHQIDRGREYYVLHTTNAELDIEELDAFLRPSIEK